VTDILTHLNEKDRAYFRKTREKRLSATLEAVAADRETTMWWCSGRPWSRFAQKSVAPDLAAIENAVEVS
jgi:hypothetical protein